MDRLRRQLFNAIEAANLPEKQEDALKDLIRGLTYDTQANLEAVIRHNSQSQEQHVRNSDTARSRGAAAAARG